MRIGVLTLAALLAACVSTSEVVSVGDNSYLVTGRASGGLNAGKETTQATKDANKFCSAKGATAVVDKIDKTGNAAVFGENVGVYFHCKQ